MQDRNKKIRIGITHGDINGISYEIILKTFSNTTLLELCTPIIYGSSKIAEYYEKILKLSPIAFNKINKPENANENFPNIINVVDDDVLIADMGKPTKMAGKLAYVALKLATDHLLKGEIDAVVTAPINKNLIQSKKFNFHGHTEYFQNRTKSKNSLMLMISEKIKIAVLTNHIPLNQVSAQVTKEKIVKKLTILNTTLTSDFLISRPKIAILSLNPHSGENGLIGNEEEKIIIPALKIASDKGILIFGPYPADGFFSSNEYKKFDAILAMYHDQGLIPFKFLSEGGGINYTAGLPVVRTSPAHGTAYNIVGQGNASPLSFRRAIYCAIDIFRNRKNNETLMSNTDYKK